MPDNKTPKTFQEVLISFGLKTTLPELSIPKHLAVFGKMMWNAATEATRLKYEDKIKAMQAEIDGKNRLLGEIGLFIRNKFIKTKEGQDLVTHKIHKELNQRGEDE